MNNEEKLPSWFPIFSSCGECDTFGFRVSEGIAVKCPCKVEYEKRILVIKGLLYANVITSDSSKEWISTIEKLSFESYKGPDNAKNLDKIKKFVKNFRSRYNSLNMFFTGIPGTQKTTMAKVIIKELVKEKLNCYYILANDLIQMIIDSSRDEEKKDRLKEIMIMDFLVIDEFDEEKIITYASGWQRKNLFPWIKYRLETIKKSTLFISNNDISNIGKYFEEAIQDLIEREVPDKTMIFDDKYYKYSERIDLTSIWDD